ncbi:MAG: toll/interleukin-1 receptor domain-containing protein [Candidatus Korobacteraceae bacterium]
MRAIFISYRRDDSEGEAGRLFDDLVKHFHENTVFMDVSAIEAGRDFRKAIDESIATCGVVLAMIGPHWLEAKDAAGTRRLDDSGDFVRIETASALKRDIPVIPVLVHGARMPRAEQLPDDLKDLAYRNAVELTHARWRSDVPLLIKALTPLVIKSGHASGASSAGQHSGSPESLPAPPPDRFRDPGNVSGTHFPPEALQRIALELANHIGPIAEIVVKRAASRCSSLEDLCRKVAEEIESGPEREKFLASVRR